MMFKPLLRLNNSTKNKEIFDPVRKKYVAYTPEEHVRQYIIYYLNQKVKIPLHMMGVEKQIKVNKLVKRPDIVAFYPSGKVFIIVECKAQSVKINQSTFDQVLRYNMPLKAKYLLLTNLDTAFCVEIANDNVKAIGINELKYC